ncbi:MAG TPA: cytochrome-c oxidase, cbb3-type subunit III [Xanthobacteraceae bacterium]|jgi:cytochrome c oxidase cbb3-type subunit 3|nr:cytochrome-c oxidase, cbb3-type subunit III [Xanthobacteraceae bacterium]
MEPRSDVSIKLGDGKVVDAKTGIATTGHEWDGIRELNNPLPRWWLWLFYATIIFSVGYWIAYPAWPLATSATQGLLNWHSRTAVAADLDGLKAQRGAMFSNLGAASVQEIIADPTLTDFARAVGREAFANNCAACHGAGGGGAKGYPNLNADRWLWGGKLDNILQTIRYGARNGNPKAHIGDMPAFGRQGILKPDQISTVADYVRSLSKLPGDPQADLARGAKIFADNCSPCHGLDGKGNHDFGAPNLTGAVWLYGSDKATIVETVTNGRGGVMPAWSERLDDTTIKALAVYVFTFGGGEK